MEKKSYTAVPPVPPEIALRYQTMTAVLSGKLSVSEGARRLGLSRNHFQTLLHRMQASMIESLEIRAGGRPATPERQKQLQQDVDKLRVENQRLRRRVETTDRILGVASGLLQGRIAPKRRSERGGNGPGDDE
jgi:hypothetical protein